MRFVSFSVRVLGLLALGMAPAGTPLAAQPLSCLIEPQQVAEVGSPVIGVVDWIYVERGDRVEKGQIIAHLRGDVERAAVGVAIGRAQAAAEEQAAQANFAFSRQKFERAQDLLAKKFISQQALDQARTELHLAEQKVAQAREQRRIARRELGLAAAQLSQRSIRSPLDGVVAERYLSAGERVEDKPLLRIAKVDPLKVQVVVPSALYGKIQPGSVASIQPQLPDVKPISARVTLVDKLVDAPSNTFRVQLELPNPDLALPAGLRCRADFGLDLPVATGRPPVAGVPPLPGTAPPAGRPAVLKMDAPPTAARPNAAPPTSRAY